MIIVISNWHFIIGEFKHSSCVLSCRIITGQQSLMSGVMAEYG